MTKQDLTPEAIAGFEAQDDAACPHLYSSACWFAWKAGSYMKRTGRSRPRAVSMGRGYHVNINDMVLAFDKKMGISRFK